MICRQLLTGLMLVLVEVRPTNVSIRTTWIPRPEHLLQFLPVELHLLAQGLPGTSISKELRTFDGLQVEMGISVAINLVLTVIERIYSDEDRPRINALLKEICSWSKRAKPSSDDWMLPNAVMTLGLVVTHTRPHTRVHTRLNANDIFHNQPFCCFLLKLIIASLCCWTSGRGWGASYGCSASSLASAL